MVRVVERFVGTDAECAGLRNTLGQFLGHEPYSAFVDGHVGCGSFARSITERYELEVTSCHVDHWGEGRGACARDGVVILVDVELRGSCSVRHWPGSLVAALEDVGGLSAGDRRWFHEQEICTRDAGLVLDEDREIGHDVCVFKTVEKKVTMEAI